MLLFADNFNFKENNFQTLFDYLKIKKIKFNFDDFNSELKKSWGNYQDYDFISEAKFDFKKYENKFDFFDIAKDEFLSSFLGKSDFLSSDLFLEKDALRLLKEKYPHDYDLCIKASFFWVNYWFDFLRKEKTTVVIVFGGNLIYAKALLKVAELLSVKCFVVEHFYTGNDFYFENRYTSLPNSSYLRSKRFINNLRQDELTFLPKLIRQNNKNVKQPVYKSVTIEDYVLLLCQVPNDFSILSSLNKWKNSILFYKKSIDKILKNSNKNIVIKVHPYERIKNNNKFKNTYDELDRYISLLSNDYANRVYLYEDYSLDGLIQGCDFAITLNSQAGLDVVRLGKQLICFGEPFYGRHGFTIDASDIDDLDIVLNKNIPYKICLNEYNKFMSAAFDHLVGFNELHKIENKFKNFKLKNVSSNDREKNTIDKNSLELVLKSNETNRINSVVNNSNNIKSNRIVLDKRQRLIRKFKKDPKSFFEDSKNPLFRLIGKII